MAPLTTQVNVRLAPDELEIVDALRQATDRPMSRAQVLRALVRDRRRALLDAQIAAAYDASPPAEGDDFGVAGARAAGMALADL